MDLSIIIVSYNTKQLLKKCIDLLSLNTHDLTYEVIIVDNGSTDGSVKYLRGLASSSKFKIILNSENVGFARANNQGLKIFHGKFVLLLNSDTEIHSNVLGEMIDWMTKNPTVGIASCNLLNKNRTVQGTGGYFPTIIRVISWMTIQDLPYVDNFIKPFHPLKPRSITRNNAFYQNQKELDWVTGAFFLIRKKVIDEIGFLDTDYFMYTEEVDYCYRAKSKGWQVVFLPKWQIIHLGGASGSTGYPIIAEFKGVKLFYKKHYPGWQYPILRLFLKLGALIRMVIFGILDGKESAKTYAKAFIEA